MGVYFVTGAARGIGLGIVSQLSATSSNTVLAAVRTVSDELKQLSSERSNLLIVQCDVSSESSIASLSTSIPETLATGLQINYVLNNAGVVADVGNQALTLKPEHLNANISTNVLGPALLLPVLLPFLAPDAFIINVSSGIASLELVTNGTIPAMHAGYSISKAALNMLTVHQAQALKGKHRIICLDPGHVKTRLGGDGASVEIADSAAGVLNTIWSLESTEQGKVDRANGRARFFSFQGTEVPW